MVKRILSGLLAAMLLLALPGCAESIWRTAKSEPAPYGYTAWQVEEDIEYLCAALEESFVYWPMLEESSGLLMEQRFEALRAGAAAATSDKELFLVISSFLKGLQSPHTSYSWGEFDGSYARARGKNGLVDEEDYMQQLAYWETVLQGCAYELPFALALVQGSYVVCQSDADGIAPCDIIETIDGLPVQVFLEENAHPYPMMTAMGEAVAGYRSTPPQLWDTGPRTLAVTLQGGSAVVWADTRPRQAYQQAATSLTVVNQGGKTIACLAIPAMGEEEIQAAIAKLNSSAVRSADALIIDVRGNSGGYHQQVEKLAIQLNGGEALRETGTYFTRQGALPEEMWQWLQETEPPARLVGGGWQCFQRQNQLGTSATAFNGPVYVLCDEMCCSAAEFFLQLVRAGGLATIVGTPTWGGMGSIPAGRRLYLLPNTGLLVQVEYCGYIAADGTVSDYGGTMPDVFVQQSMEDYQAFLQSGQQSLQAGAYDTAFQYCVGQICGEGR